MRQKRQNMGMAGQSQQLGAASNEATMDGVEVAGDASVNQELKPKFVKVTVQQVLEYFGQMPFD